MSKCYTIKILDSNARIMKNRRKYSNVNTTIIAHEEVLRLGMKNSVEVSGNVYVFLIRGYNQYWT